MSDTEIQALIALIDDPDEGIYTHVRDRILSLGEPVVPVLERAWEVDDLGDLFRNRIEDLLHTIHLDLTYNRLVAWKKEGGEDLLSGALIVCRYRYAELDENRVKGRLAALRQDIWLELNDNLTAFEKVRVFNHIFFQVHGFKGNKRNYHAPQNSYINEVLESRKGNPLSLAVIYQVLAEELDLPMRGVNLPNHFVLAYMDETGVAASELGHGERRKPDEQRNEPGKQCDVGGEQGNFKRIKCYEVGQRDGYQHHRQRQPRKHQQIIDLDRAF